MNNYLLGMITLAVLFGLGYIIGFVMTDEPEPPQEQCTEVGQVMSDGTIVYSGQPGGEAMVVFATSQGPKLMKCE